MNERSPEQKEIDMSPELRGLIAKLAGWYQDEDGCWCGPNDRYEVWAPPHFDYDADAIELLVEWIKRDPFSRSATPQHIASDDPDHQGWHCLLDDKNIEGSLESYGPCDTLRDAIIGAFLSLIRLIKSTPSTKAKQS